MKNTENTAHIIKKTIVEFIGFIDKYRMVIIVLIASIAVLSAVLQTQGHLNPPRNEAEFLELKSSISVKKLDEEVLRKLQQTQDDLNASVDSDFVPNRNNPFVE
jgi:hypothetical protein